MTTLDTYAREGRLIRNEWSGTDAAGRETLCLYTALAGDAEARPETCPAELCPTWLAHLLPWLDDAGSAEAWPSVVRRVVALAPRLGALHGETSTRLDYTVRALCITEAMRHTADAAALAACRTVLALCERRASGDVPTDDEWRARAAAAHDAAAAAAARADAAAARADAAARAAAARDAARDAFAAAAARDAAAAAAAAYPAARDAAARADAAAYAAARADAAAYPAARAYADAAADRLADAILTAVEAGCAP